MFRIYARRPDMATEIERAALVQLVAAGGALTADAVRASLPRAEALVFCTTGGQVVGVAALKVPHPAYRRGLTLPTKAGIPLPEDRFPCELGHLAVAPAQRRLGLGRMLGTAVLTLAQGRGLFATTGLDVMQAHILPRLGFVAAGQIWQGRAEPVALMLRP